MSVYKNSKVLPFLFTLNMFVILSGCTDSNHIPTNYTAASDRVSNMAATTLPAPMGLTAATSTSTSVTLNWTLVTGATGYIVKSKATNGTAAFTQIAQVGNVSTYTNTGLNKGWYYTYEVIATNSAGDSNPSSSVSIQVLGNGSMKVASGTPVPTSSVTLPTSPPSLKATTSTTTSVNLQWTQVSGAMGYLIESKPTNGTAGFVQVAQVGNVSTYTNTGLNYGWYYTFEVIALNSAGSSSPSSPVSIQVLGNGSTAIASGTPAPTPAATPIPTPTTPSAPTNLTATSTTTTSVTLNWTPMSGATGYIVESKATNGTTGFAQVAQVGSVSTYTNTGLTYGWYYTYEVIAVNSAGNSNPSTSVAIQVVGNSTGSSGGSVPTPTPTSTVNPQPTPVSSSPPTSTPTGTVYNISAGANSAMILSTLKTAAASGSASTVLFAAGSYSLSSQLDIPCPTSPLYISGPAISYPGPGPFTGNGPYLATINSTVTGGWAISLPTNNCQTAITIENINFNGSQPAAGGGGIFYLPQGGGANVTITHNYIHGIWANASGPQSYDALVFIDGCPTCGSWNNSTISWNTLGAATDCNVIMQLYDYWGGPLDSTGGYCTAVAFHTNSTNLSINNNAIYHVEEGIKGLEGPGAAPFFVCNNLQINYNDVSNVHRTPIEAQLCNMTLNYNSVHDSYYPNWATWGMSLPQLNFNYTNSNVMLANTPVLSGGGTVYPGAFEWWSSGTSDNNLVQGYWGAGWQWGYASALTSPAYAPSTVSFNIVGMQSSSRYIVAEGYPILYAPTPIQSGNVTSSTVSAVVSGAPTISSGSTSGQVVITDNGITGAGPKGNTSIYYTTDGSIPTTSSTLYTGPFTVNSGTTVKAIGMWGAQNQPKSYQAGYGFVPSNVVNKSF